MATTIGGQFTTPKRNLISYVETTQYEQLRQLAAIHGLSVSAETAKAINYYLKDHLKELGVATRPADNIFAR